MLCLVAVTVNPEPVRRPCRLGDAAIPATVFVAPDSSPVVVSCCRLVLLFVGIMLDWRLDLLTWGRRSCLLFVEQDEGQARGGQAGDPDPIGAHQRALRLVRLHPGRPRCQGRHTAVVRLEQCSVSHFPIRTALFPVLYPLYRGQVASQASRPASEPM